MWAFYFIAAGGALGVVWLRGRRIGDEPRCGRCGFDRRGLAKAEDPCSECGCPVSEPQAVVFGRRVRPAWAGRVAILLLAIGGSYLLASRNTSHLGWMPSWFLTGIEYRLASPSHREAIAGELERRLANGQESYAALDGLLDRIVAEVESSDQPHLDAAGWRLLQGAVVARARPPSDLGRYAVRAVTCVPTGDVARQAGMARVRVVYDGAPFCQGERVLLSQLADVTATVIAVDMDGQRIPVAASTRVMALQPARWVQQLDLPLGLPAGRHRGEAEILLASNGVERLVRAPLEVTIPSADRVVDEARVRTALASRLAAKITVTEPAPNGTGPTVWVSLSRKGPWDGLGFRPIDIEIVPPAPWKNGSPGLAQTLASLEHGGRYVYDISGWSWSFDEEREAFRQATELRIRVRSVDLADPAIAGDTGLLEGLGIELEVPVER